MTPWKFRIELQKHTNAVTDDKDMFIDQMTITLPFDHHPSMIAELFGINNKINSSDKVIISNGSWELILDTTDTVGTKLFSKFVKE